MNPAILKPLLKFITNPKVLMAIAGIIAFMWWSNDRYDKGIAECENGYKEREINLLRGIQERRVEHKKEVQMLSEELDRRRSEGARIIYDTIEVPIASPADCPWTDVARLSDTRTRSINMFSRNPSEEVPGTPDVRREGSGSSPGE